SKECCDMLETIASEGHRMAELTRQMLAYAKGGKYREDILSLNTVILQAIELTHKGKATEIEVILDLSDNLWDVSADHSQMQQVMMNIVTNAFEVLMDSGGVVTIRTSNVTKQEDWKCDSHHIHPAGKYAYVIISDTGPGIQKEIQERIFEPFFSTKFVGRGLGLAAAAGIVRNHGGCITLSSSSQEPGASFHVLIPREEETEETEATVSVIDKSLIEGKILVVDDEPHVLNILRDILTHHDIEVLTAESGIKALDLMTRLKDDINLVILDIQMPGMNGKEVFRTMKSIRPDLRIFILSGYDEDTALSGINLDSQDEFIQKPISMDILLKKIQKVTGSNT
ncbi:response regulator, partial [Thermodesulfobacteriota bacterium]